MRALIVLLAACSHVPVSVRETAAGERWPSAGDELDMMFDTYACREEAGELAPALYDPLRAYVRDKLVGRGARIFLDVGQETPADEGMTVKIAPRDDVGTISIVGRSGNADYMARVYCVHVVRRAEAILLVLELEHDVIIG